MRKEKRQEKEERERGEESKGKADNREVKGMEHGKTEVEPKKLGRGDKLG